MSLTSALNNSLSGLRFTSTATALTSANIANAGNPSYTRKVIDPVQMLAGDRISGIAVGSIRREYDAFVQQQLVKEKSNQAYSTVRSDFLSRLDQMFGTPGSAQALDTVLNTLSSSFQTLLTSPESQTARSGVINSATVAAQTLRSLSTSVQDMRLDAEQGLADATRNLNGLLDELSKVNSRLSVAFDDEARVGLLDQRDKLVDDVSQYVSVHATYGDDGAVQLYGASGFTLLSSTEKANLSFDARDYIGPTNRYDTDPAKRSVGTITARTSSGSVDLIAQGVFKSGRIAGLIDLRDKTLPAAQEQLDQIAAGMAQMLGSSSSSTAVTAGTQAGFDTPLGPGLSDGDTVTVEATVNGQTRKFTFKRVDDTTVPMSDTMSADPNDVVVRLTGTSAAGYATQMQAAIDAWAATAGAPAGAFAVSASGGNLRVMADPAVMADAKVASAAAHVTARTLTDGGAALPFFVDAAMPNGIYSDQVTASGSQFTGFAARIDVNAALKADATALVKIGATTPESDSARPSFLVSALSDTSRYFTPAGNIGTAANPFQGSVMTYMRAVIVSQTNEASSAKQIAEGQNTVVSQLQARYDSTAAVNIDQEMMMLIQLQNSYGANARVMSAVREMFDMLRQM